MAWAPAQKASGQDWMAPFLAQLLDDPYEALRFIVDRSLRSTPGFARFDYDFTAPQPVRAATIPRAMETWRATRDHINRSNPSELLLNAEGDVMMDVVNRLVQTRDNRPVYLRE